MENISEKFKKIIDGASSKTGLGKKAILAVALALTGALALFGSEIFKSRPVRPSAETSRPAVNADSDEYEKKLEERLASMISAVEGAGKTKVMITLECSDEDIYLHDYDYEENRGPSGKSGVERRDKYVIVGASNDEKGIVVRVARPKIRGVAVVCEGGGSAVVRNRIVETVTALLDISGARVSVAKMS